MTRKTTGGKRTRSDTIWTWAVALLFLLAIVAGIRLMANPRPAPIPSLNAVVIDQLSPQYPNEPFRSSVTASLEAFDLPVSAFEGDDVDTDLYRSLPSHSPGVVLIRSHSGILVLESEDAAEHVTALFTNEPYSAAQHVAEQLNERLLIVRPFEDDAELTFGVSPSFIRSSMTGRLPRSIVIIAGCSCLGRIDLAEAFIDRGASVVISWDGSVTLDHLDEATALLLERFFRDGMTLEQAVIAAMVKYGQDPEFGALMTYYPVAAGRYTADQLLGREAP